VIELDRQLTVELDAKNAPKTVGPSAPTRRRALRQHGFHRVVKEFDVHWGEYTLRAARELARLASVQVAPSRPRKETA